MSNLQKRINPPLYHQSYVDTGDGPVVILLHGLFGNLAMWKKLIDVLKKDHRVIVPRLPIFDLPIEHTNVKYLAKVLQEFLDWHQLTDVSLVGHALGGQVALMYTQLNPSNVKKIILTGSSGLFENSPFLDQHLSPVGSYDFVNDRVRDVFFDKGLAPKKLIEEVYQAVQNIPKRMAIGELARSSKQNNVLPFLSKLNHPVLLVWGLQDSITPPEVALHFHDLLLHSELRFIDHSGHLPMVEQSEKFNNHLVAFLHDRYS